MNEYGYPLIMHPQSPQIDVLTQSILKAKGILKPIGKSGYNKNQNYYYAVLLDIYDAIEPALSSVGIIIKHQSEWYDGRFFLVTRFFHTVAQQWIQDVSPIENEKPGNQGRGCALTYMKKQAILNLMAIAADEDDDGESEQKHIDAPRITESQYQEIGSLIQAHLNRQDIWNAISSKNRIKDLRDLKASEYGGVKYFIVNYKKPVQK